MKTYVEKWKAFKLNESEERRTLWALIFKGELIALSGNLYGELMPILTKIIEKEDGAHLLSTMNGFIEDEFGVTDIELLSTEEREELKSMAIEAMTHHDEEWEDCIQEITSFEQLDRLVKGDFSYWGRSQAEKFVKSALVRKNLF